MTTLMYNSENDEILLIEAGLWFEDKDDSCARYYTKMEHHDGEMLFDDDFEDAYNDAKSRGYVKIGEL